MIVTVPDIAGDGQAHAIGYGLARWVQFVAGAGNTNAIRIGDLNVSSTRGIPLSSGGEMFLPALSIHPHESNTGHLYDLGAIYYKVSTGDTVSITYYGI